MLSITLASLRSQARRFLAPGLAIVLGVGFVAATLVLGNTLSSSTMTALTGDLGHYSAVVTPADRAKPVPARALAAVTSSPVVREVRAVRQGVAQITTRSGRSVVVLSSPPSPTSPARVAQGHLPTSSGQVALSESVAASSGLRLGETTPIAPLGREGATAGKATVVGIIDAARDPRYAGGSPIVFAVIDQVATWTGEHGFSELDVIGRDGASAASVVTGLRAQLGKDVVVRTGTEQAKATVSDVTGGTNFLAGILLGFAAVALFVSTLVIANTFTILLARRARETALMRCVGATRAQLLRSALAEALVLGVGFSAVGVAAGVSLGALVSGLSGSAHLGIPMSDLSVSVLSVIVPMVVGVLVTLVATVLPVLRSTRVAPLAALRPAMAVSVRSRAGVVRLVVGFVLLVVGFGLLALGGAMGSLLPGIAGGMMSFLGVLMCGSVLIPAVAKVIGVLPSRLAGVPGQLAVDNSVRNPRRAATTTSALLVGVTLIAMMSVGAATSRASIDQALNKEFAVDLAVTTQTSAVPQRTIAALGSVSGVAATSALRGGQVRVGHLGKQEVVSVPTDAGQVMHNRGVLDQLRPGTLLVSQDAASSGRLTSGQHVRVASGSQSRELTVRVGSRLGYDYTTTEQDLLAVAPHATVHSVWLRLKDNADVTKVMVDVQSATSDLPDASTAGSASRRAQLTQILDVMLWVATGLLGISVLIAVVGIGNTLSLSVLERTQESALLRALGLTRGQLRAMLGMEALLLAVVGAALGTALGVGYGWAAARCLFGQQTAVLLTVPWGRLGLVAGGALLAGVLASVVPARRAARVAPAAALAAD